jgi:hypothetical protein
MKAFADPEVAAVFSAYPAAIRRRLISLRKLILDTAAATAGVGDLEEALRWGEPAYLTTASKSGSPIRIGWKKSAPSQYAIYFHCQTKLIGTFRRMFAGVLHFEGNRAIVFEENDRVPAKELSRCIALALTYHRAVKRKRR